MKIVKSSLIAMLAITTLFAEADATQQKSEEIKSNAQLQKELQELKKKYEGLQEQVDTVQQHDAKDNIKFTVDFRNEYNYIKYEYDKYSYKGKDWSGTEAKNDGLFTSRIFLNMKSSPVKKLTFTGQLAAYALWGAHVYEEDSTLKGWSASSKPGDTIFRIRQAYFVYSDTFSNGLPYAFSVGRRQSTDGFLANFREGNEEPGSPLAHITNMEVDGMMFKLTLDKYTLPGAFIKAVYGRAHTGGIETLYDRVGYKPYAQEDGDVNENVDFLVLLGNIYDNGQYKLMFEHATIFNTKGARVGYNIGAALPDGGKNKSLDAGTAYLDALSFQVTGIGDMINDFLDSTTLFLSLARTQYSPNAGHELLGSTDDEDGYSVWTGFSIPDMITEKGKIGFEYNHGSKYWTPMTWAEDSVLGSKLAVRGDAYEAYWNFHMFGLKNLTGQLRYTYEQHDYTPNIRCSGWVAPKPVDITAQNLRAFVRYQY
jgi:hypothetical protein